MKSVMIIAGLALGMVQCVSAQAVIPGWLTDPTNMKGALGSGDEAYQTPEKFKYPYVSTYYVKPTVTPDEEVKVGIYVTDFEHSKIRFLDKTHRFNAFLEYRVKGGESKTLTLKNLASGDAEFKLGRLPVGEYELRVWAVDAKGRESHRVIQDFRVMTKESLTIPADKVYRMTAADLKTYGIRNDGDLERVVYVGTDGRQTVMKEKRAGVPGYVVTVKMDPKTGKVPYRGYKNCEVVYDEGYDKTLVESNAVLTATGIQKLLDDKAAAGFRKVVMLPGVYRVSHEKPIFMPDHFTWDLGKATIKLNQFYGEKSMMIRFASAIDAHLVGGTVEGDYWAHDYTSPKDSEWVNGFQLSGDSWYCSVEGVTVKEITGYGGSNFIENDSRGSLAFFCERLPKFAKGGLDAKTGLVDPEDPYRFTTDFMSLKKITEKLGRRRLQISRYLGYQGIHSRSWQLTVAWYDSAKQFISGETAWQYREMWIPANAAYMRVSAEDKSLEAINPKLYTEELQAVAIRYPINCAIRNCRFERCRCVGYAASQMKNWIFEGNFFTESGEAEAKCAFDAEDGADQMQDAYFLRNTFRDNPVNNSILTCAGHNFILEKNDGSIHFWGRTHSPCVRDNDVEQATYYCDNRIRSGYGRFEGNRYTKGIKLGLNDWKDRPDHWDDVISGETFDGSKADISIEVGNAGRMVGCTFKNMKVGIGNAFACQFENCKGWFTRVHWLECTMKDSQFKGFYFTNSWENCRFVNTRLEGIGKSTLAVKKSDFTDCTLAGCLGSSVAMKDCSFKGSVLESAGWEDPSQLLFKNCKIATRDDKAFFDVGLSLFGRTTFDGCTVTGKQPLVHVKEVRQQKYDNEPATLVLKNLHWKGHAKTVVSHRSVPREAYSQKKLVIDGSASVLSSSVKLMAEPFPNWETK